MKVVIWERNPRLATRSLSLSFSRTCQPVFDLWRVISDGGNAQGLGVRYERLSVGGVGRINEVPELRRDGSHHYQASQATSAR